MPNPVVVDASPLIALARTGYLPLLNAVGDPIFVPRAVVQEVQRRGPTDPAQQALAGTPWLLEVDPGPTPATLQRYRLDPGETAVLTWALTHPGTTVVLDERRGRNCANALKIHCVGTARLVIAARQQGIIVAARPILEQLRQAGFYLSDRVMGQILALVGE